MPEPDDLQTPETPAPASLTRPLVGMAISVCVGVVFLLTLPIALCAGGGFNGGGGSATGTPFLVAICLLPVVTFFGCLVWLLVNAIRKALAD